MKMRWLIFGVIMPSFSFSLLSAKNSCSLSRRELLLKCGYPIRRQISWPSLGNVAKLHPMAVIPTLFGRRTSSGEDRFCTEEADSGSTVRDGERQVSFARVQLPLISCCTTQF